MDLSQYKWEITPDIQNKLQEVEVFKKVFEKLPILESTAKIIRRRSILNSAVSSAQIESIHSTIQSPRKEGKNLQMAYEWIYSGRDLPDLSVNIIKDLHARVMRDLFGSAGQLRIEPWAVFNEAGMVIHLAPLHTRLPKLMQEYISFINKLSDNACVQAAVSQFIFEKIHPFADGNGRTGRLISAYVLHQLGFSLSGLVPIEKYINQHRSWYYRTLEPSHNCTEFTVFFIEAIITQANQTLEEIKNPDLETPEGKLLPRRREVFETIKDHPESTFDFLHRRFIGLNSLVLHRDLQHLQKIGLIKKLGSTRGAVYVAVSPDPSA